MKKQKGIKKAAIKKTMKKVAIKKASAVGIAPLGRAVCITDSKKLSGFISMAEARAIARQHENEFPNHVVDVEEKI